MLIDSCEVVHWAQRSFATFQFVHNSLKICNHTRTVQLVGVSTLLSIRQEKTFLCSTYQRPGRISYRLACSSDTLAAGGAAAASTQAAWPTPKAGAAAGAAAAGDRAQAAAGVAAGTLDAVAGGCRTAGPGVAAGTGPKAGGQGPK